MAQTWNVSNHDWKLMKQNSSLMPHKCPGEQRTHTELLKYFGLMFGSRAKNRDDSGMKRHHFHHISCLGGDPGLTGQILEVRYTRTSVETRNKYSLIISYYVLFNLFLKTIHFKESSGYSSQPHSRFSRPRFQSYIHPLEVILLHLTAVLLSLSRFFLAGSRFFFRVFDRFKNSRPL